MGGVVKVHFSRTPGVNGERGATRTEEQHWVLCVWHPVGEPTSVKPRLDVELQPGSQRADGNSQRGEQRRSCGQLGAVLKLARWNGGDRRPRSSAPRSEGCQWEAAGLHSSVMMYEPRRAAPNRSEKRNPLFG